MKQESKAVVFCSILILVSMAVLVSVKYIREYVDVKNATDTSAWIKTDARSIRWQERYIGNRVMAIEWSVRYEYFVDGVLYAGENISADKKTIVVDPSMMPYGIARRLEALNSVWYSPEDHSKSALFIFPPHKLESEIRSAAYQLEVKEKSKWSLPVD